MPSRSMRANQLEKTSSPTSVRRRSFTRSQRSWSVLVIGRPLANERGFNGLTTRTQHPCGWTQRNEADRAPMTGPAMAEHGERSARQRSTGGGDYQLGVENPDAKAIRLGRGRQGPGGGCCFEPAQWPTGLVLIIMPLQPSQPPVRWTCIYSNLSKYCPVNPGFRRLFL